MQGTDIWPGWRVDAAFAGVEAAYGQQNKEFDADGAPTNFEGEIVCGNEDRAALEGEAATTHYSLMIDDKLSDFQSVSLSTKTVASKAEADFEYTIGLQSTHGVCKGCILTFSYNTKFMPCSI